MHSIRISPHTLYHVAFTLYLVCTMFCQSQAFSFKQIISAVHNPHPPDRQSCCFACFDSKRVCPIMTPAERTWWLLFHQSWHEHLTMSLTSFMAENLLTNTTPPFIQEMLSLDVTVSRDWGFIHFTAYSVTPLRDKVKLAVSGLVCSSVCSKWGLNQSWNKMIDHFTQKTTMGQETCSSSRLPLLSTEDTLQILGFG